MAYQRKKRLIGAAAAVLLTSCGSTPLLDNASRVETAQAVGNVYISAYPAVPWSEIGAKLEPKHNLSTADARAMAAITTQGQVSQFLSTFSAGLGLGLPSKSWSRSTSVNADGVVENKSGSKRESGVAPDSTGLANTEIAEDALAAELSKAAVTSGIDASTQLMGGTAVFQLAAILDNQLGKAWLPRGYQANLITFQVNLQPARRNLPYDTYINLTMLPGDLAAGVSTSSTLSRDAGAFPPVMVYPLVIADATETSSIAKSVEVMRQAALSLSGIVNNIGLNAGLKGGSDRLDAIVAGDRNSLTTVGRVSDHTVRIRIGAQQQGSSKLAMVPKTQNISMVVFTRAADFYNGYLDRLAIVSEVSFADVNSGAALPEKPRAEARREMEAGVHALMRRHQFRPYGIDECGGPADVAANLVRAAERSEYQYLSRCLVIAPADTSALYRAQLAATENETAHFSKADFGVKDGPMTYLRLCDFRGNGSCSKPVDNKDQTHGAAQADEEQPQKDERPSMPAHMESEFRRFVGAMMLLQASSLEQRMLIALPFKGAPTKLPDGAQMALLQDDKHNSKVELRGGTSLRLDKLEARLCIGAATKFLVPLSASVTEAEQTFIATFPSLLKYQLAKTGDRLTMRVTHGNLSQNVQSPCTCPTDSFPGPLLCAMYALTPVPPTTPDAENPLQVTTATLVMDRSGNASLAVTPGKTTGILVRVGGAELRSAQPAIKFDPANNAYELPVGTVTMLKLGNLTPSRNVYLYGLAGDKVVGSPIVLPVQPAAHAGR